MNNSYYENIDENFNKALDLYEREYSHDELIEFLKNGNIVQRQISALKIDGICSVYDAAVFLDNLTGQDGKIREAVSLRINEYMSDVRYLPYFDAVKNYQIFLDAIIDINANICRNIISAVTNLKNNEDFCIVFCAGLVNMADNFLKIIEKLDLQEGKYKVNKEIFKLYWVLETVYEFYDKIKLEDLKRIIIRS